MIKRKIELKRFNPNDIDLIICDIDGTLHQFKTLEMMVKEAIESFGIIYSKEHFEMELSGVKDAITEAGNPNIPTVFSFERLCYHWGKYFTFFKEYHINIEEFAKRLINLELKYSHPMPSLRKTLEYLKSFSKYMVCSTDWLLYIQKQKLEKFGVSDLFSHIYTAEYLISKASPKHFEYILNDFDVAPSRVVMIGDSASDMVAKEVGINTILIDTDGTKMHLYENADRVVREFHNVKGAFRLK